MIIAILFIFGTIAGSLMNVCIHRMPRKESIIRPRSHCTSCGRTIPWHDNIPVLSYIFLKAKCRFCGNKISVIYPIVEVLSGLMWVACFLRFGLTGKFFIMCFFFSSLIVVSFIDLAFREIPDEITLPGMILGLGLALLCPPCLGRLGSLPAALDSFLGILIGGLSIYVLGFLGEFIFKKEAMGGGDIKLLAMIGAFTGWKLVLLTFFLAPVFGSIVGIILKIRKGAETIPYGPHLSLAAFVSVFYGQEILHNLFFIK